MTTTPKPLSQEREQTIRETHPGDWYSGPWTQGPVETSGDEPAYHAVYHHESGTVLAQLPDWAANIALFICDAHDAVRELLDEVVRLRTRLAKLEDAQRQIRAIHTDSPMGPCPVCFDSDAYVAGGDGLVSHPCPTARLAGAEPVEPSHVRAAGGAR